MMNDIILTPNQLRAIEFFEKYGYLVLEGPRICGKTTILKEIIRRNPNAKIGVKTPTAIHYHTNYRNFKNCEYMGYANPKYDYDIIIGDEVYIKPQEKVRIACALTPNYLKFIIPFGDIPNISPTGDFIIKKTKQGEQNETNNKTKKMRPPF